MIDPPSYKVCLLTMVAIAVALIAAMPTALLINPAIAAQPPVSDRFNTSGWYQAPNTNNELRTWRQRAAASDEFRTRTQDCLDILDEVAAHETKSRDLHRQAGLHRGDSRFIQLHRAALDENQIAADLIAKFWDCVNSRWRSRPDSFSTKGDPSSVKGDPDNQGGNDSAPPARSPFVVCAKDEWDAWNQRLAAAINREFQKNSQSFRSQYGGDRVPLKVRIEYYIQGPPTTTMYNNKKLAYGIFLKRYNVEAIPYSNQWNLSSSQLRTLQNNFLKLVQQSLNDAMISHQSELKFPQCDRPIPNGRYDKVGTFSNDLGAAQLIYDEAPTQRY